MSHDSRYCLRGELTYFINSKTIRRGMQFLRDSQQPEGGWVGSWGICFTYATMFALEGLALAGETYETSESARRACDYLVSKQRADGGWGESYKVCHLLPSSFGLHSVFGAGMRSIYMGRPRKYPSGPNVLGSIGTHVREVPSYGTDRKCCETGHVAAATGSWSRFTSCPSHPHVHDIIPGRLMGARGHRRELHSDVYVVVCELQALFYGLDAWEGT